MQTQFSVDFRYVRETKKKPEWTHLQEKEIAFAHVQACKRARTHSLQLLLLYLVIGFIVSDGSSDVINQRVDKILTLPHRSPAIRTGRAQISRKQNKTMRQPDICHLLQSDSGLLFFLTLLHHIRRVSNLENRLFSHKYKMKSINNAENTLLCNWAALGKQMYWLIF